MSTCHQCGTEHAEGKRFCRSCGAPLTAGCPACGATVQPDSRFCEDCGAPLTGSAPPVTAGEQDAVAAPGDIPVAERRVCSVLFCDLVGFTTLSESRDPEEVRELLSGYFESSRTIIERYGGVVEKFIGDAVMAVWGTPTATEGDAERCVRAALDVVTSVRELGQQAHVPTLEARAGVVTGEVAVTLRATGEGMVAGDAVNTAARVQSAATPGTVWTDATTQRLAAGGIGFAPAGEHALKGKAGLVPLWSVTRVLSGIGGSQRVDGLEAPLSGRDAELRTIKELFHASAERRTPHLVVMTGPAGVGKSRLGWEFEKYVDGLARGVWWHRGRCLSYGEGVTFWALAEIVRQRLTIAEDDPLDVAAAKLVEGLSTYVPDTAERAYVGPRLARLLGVPFAGGGDAAFSRDELFAGWRVFFERLAAVDPVVLLVENAQYADEGLLDFLDHLIDWARDAPIYVLVFGRPELYDRRPGFGAGRNRSILRVEPLDAAAMEQVVDALVPGMPSAARDTITRQAQGIPLFAVETVRSLVDHDIVVPQDGVYRLVGDVAGLTVPDSLHGLLAARLDALDEQLRHLVADAAVIGSSFPAEALVAVSTLPEETVRRGLEQLLRREVLAVTADRLSPQVGEYQFSQDLLRQVAYERLSRHDRKTRHLAVAAHLRSVFSQDGDEVAEVVAQHYLDAVEAVPDATDVAAIRADAITMLVRAAQRSERAGSPSAAAAAYARAAEQTRVAGDEPATARFLQQGAAAADRAADLDTLIALAERAEASYTSLGELRAAARCVVVVGGALVRAGRLSEARERLTAALSVLRADPDADTVLALNHVAQIEALMGGPEAEKLSTEGLALGQALDVDDSLIANLLIVRGIAHEVADRHAEAAAYFRHAADVATEAGDGEARARAFVNLSDMLTARDMQAAAEYARLAAEEARKIGHHDYLAMAVINQSSALLLMGAWDEADQLHRDAVEEGLGESWVGIYISLLAALRGHPEEAVAIAVAPEIRASEDPQDIALLATTDAFLAASRGDVRALLDHARVVTSRKGALGIGHDSFRWTWPLAMRAAHDSQDVTAEAELVALLEPLSVGHIPPLLRAEQQLARARSAARSSEPATTEAFAHAVVALRAAGSTFHLAHGLLDQAGHLQSVGCDDEAQPLIAEAEEIAVRLRAEPLQARVRAVAAQSTAPPAHLSAIDSLRTAQ